MDPSDPDFFISPDNPLAQLVALVIAVGLLTVLWSAFRSTVRKAGLAKAIFFWAWNAAFFPVVFVAAKSFGWWALAVMAVWFVPLAAFDHHTLPDIDHDEA